jgi:hypothetical protein
MMKKHIVTYSTENAAYVEGRKMWKVVIIATVIITIISFL